MSQRDDFIGLPTPCGLDCKGHAQDPVLLLTACFCSGLFRSVSWIWGFFFFFFVFLYLVVQNILQLCRHFPSGTSGKESSSNARDAGLIPGYRRSPEEGNGNPLWYSCLGNPMDRGAWRATVHGAAKTPCEHTHRVCSLLL